MNYYNFRFYWFFYQFRRKIKQFYPINIGRKILKSMGYIRMEDIVDEYYKLRPSFWDNIEERKFKLKLLKWYEI